MKLTRSQIISHASSLAILLTCLVWLRLAMLGRHAEKIKPKFPAWTVICDKNGSYNFTNADGEPFSAGGWSTRTEAEEECNGIKAIEDQATGIKAHAAFVRSQPWEICTEPPKPDPDTTTKIATPGPIDSPQPAPNATKFQTPTPNLLTITDSTPTLVLTQKEASSSIIFAGRNNAWLTISPIKVPEGVHWDGSTGVYYPEHTKLLLTVEPVVRKTTDGWEITFKTEDKK